MQRRLDNAILELSSERTLSSIDSTIDSGSKVVQRLVIGTMKTHDRMS
jgi:hypothetical protein